MIVQYLSISFFLTISVFASSLIEKNTKDDFFESILPSSSAVSKPNNKEQIKPSKKVVMYDLREDIQEGYFERKAEPFWKQLIPISNPLDLFSDLFKKEPVTHFKMVQSLTKVLHDDDVEAVVLFLDNAKFSIVQLEEYYRLLQKMKTKGKKIWLYSRNYNIFKAALAGCCNFVHIHPQSDIALAGIATSVPYYKSALQKVGASMEVAHIGDFKTAGENFRFDKPSKEQREELTTIIAEIYDILATMASQRNQLTLEQFKKACQQVVYSTQQLKELNLIDDSMTLDNFFKKVNHVHKSSKWVYNPYLKSEEGDTIKLSSILNLLNNYKKSYSVDKPYTAMLNFSGAIDSSYINKMKQELNELAKDKLCKALVLRINSPGGSATASEYFHNDLVKFKQKNKPIVVSMGNIAASGGYYVSTPADYIYAQKATITGSIGVVCMKLCFEGTAKKAGVSIHDFSIGSPMLQEIMSIYKKWRPKHIKLLTAMMLETYTTFKNRVVSGRGNKLKLPFSKMADGRVYNGKKALKIGLVDAIGGLSQAIEKANELSGNKNNQVIEFPRYGSKFDDEVYFQRPSVVSTLLQSIIPQLAFSKKILSDLDFIANMVKKHHPANLIHFYSQPLPFFTNKN